jgi:glucose-1-phosphatase
MDFLFDIGRVLLDFDFETSLIRLVDRPTTTAAGAVGEVEELAGPESAVARLERLLERKDEFEAGAIGRDAYIRWALDVLGCNATEEEFIHAWRNIFTPNEPMWDCVRRLVSGGHRLIVFSNTNAIHCPWIFEEYPEFSLFAGRVLSFETGSVKPLPEIYRHAIASFGLIPARTGYIDDLPDNIATGREFGFRAFQYDISDHASFEQWLAGELART